MYKYLQVIIILFCLMPVLSGCSTLGYYLQSIQGQAEVLQKSTPIEKLLQDDHLPAALREKLLLASELRRFAARQLLLPDNGSYQDYADLGRNYVVWNVFATPELSLQPQQWCYLIVGCLGYRGYFSEILARKHADELRASGYDVFVGGVAAYSTLGWFNDPVLNTMLRHDDFYLARVIFHELAHQLLFIPNDTDFNEAFADSIAETGTERWLTQTQPESVSEAFSEILAHEDEFTALVLNYRAKLEELYRSSMADQYKLEHKQMLFTLMQSDYAALKAGWNNDIRYDAWFAAGLNNAKLVAVSTYRRLLPGFRLLLRSVNHDLKNYYNNVKRLGACPQERRHEILMTGQTDFKC